MSEQTRSFQAVVASKASKEMEKSSGAKYVIHNIEFTEEGPLQGKKTGACYTTLNSKNEEKPDLVVGTKVLAYLHYEMKDGKKIPRFEIDPSETVSVEEIEMALNFNTNDQTL